MRWVPFFCCACVCAFGGASGVVVAQDEALVDEFHRDVSRRFGDFIDSIDVFFADEEQTVRANESWARLRADLISIEDEDPEFRANAKLKLVLPRTEQKLRLLLSTEEEDTRDPDRALGGSTTGADTSGDVSFALRFLRSLRDDSGVKFDIGAKVRDGEIQAFGRIGAFVRHPLDKNWHGTLSNDAIYYSESGFEDTLTLTLERFLDQRERLLLLSNTSFGWREGNSGAEINQNIGLYRNISSRTSVALEFRTLFITAPEKGEKRLSNGEVRFRLRQNIWRPWFYYELSPSISWPAEKDYVGLTGGLVRIEVVIGHVE